MSSKMLAFVGINKFSTSCSFTYLAQLRKKQQCIIFSFPHPGLFMSTQNPQGNFVCCAFRKTFWFVHWFLRLWSWWNHHSVTFTVDNRYLKSFKEYIFCREGGITNVLKDQITVSEISYKTCLFHRLFSFGNADSMSPIKIFRFRLLFQWGQLKPLHASPLVLVSWCWSITDRFAANTFPCS